MTADARLVDVFDLSDRTLIALVARGVRTAGDFARHIERERERAVGYWANPRFLRPADVLYDLTGFAVPYEQCEADAAAILAAVPTGATAPT